MEEKPRNFVAKNLKLNKPKIIPDKRRQIKEKLQEQENKRHENREDSSSSTH